jgi:hypothetical protein
MPLPRLVRSLRSALLLPLRRCAWVGRGFLLSLLLFHPLTQPASAKDYLKVYPASTRAPATVRVTIHVDASPENRGVEWMILGEWTSISSFPLEGDLAPETFVFDRRDIPSGEYEIRAILYYLDGGKIKTRPLGMTPLMVW